MVDEKKGGKTQARDASSVEDLARETVLDFLWGTEAAEGAGPSAQNAQPQPAQALPGQPAAARHEAPSAGGLKDALDRYSTWLDSWAEPA